MCGRFAQSKMEDALVEEYGITGAVPTSPLPASWNIAPTKEIYIVRNENSHDRELGVASWGLIGSWYKDVASARASQSHAINARRESIFEKPTFRDAVRKRRWLRPLALIGRSNLFIFLVRIIILFLSQESGTNGFRLMGN
jgi:putative SOS response-associated peptidase YedK